MISIRRTPNSTRYRKSRRRTDTPGIKTPERVIKSIVRPSKSVRYRKSMKISEPLIPSKPLKSYKSSKTPRKTHFEKSPMDIVRVKFKTPSPHAKFVKGSLVQRLPNSSTPRRGEPLTSRERLRLNKNRDCYKQEINKCINQDIILIGNPVVIGAGTFGVLLKVATSRPGYDVAIKFMFTIRENTKKSSEMFESMEKELNFSYYMGHLGIGPNVLDSFHYNLEFEDFIKIHTLQIIFEMVSEYFKNKRGTDYPRFDLVAERLKSGKDLENLPVEIQCIVMKAYETDCFTPLTDLGVNIYIKEQIIKQMTNLLYNQIKNGLYCWDIKSQNFVVNYKNTPVNVKMIDFGADFCTEENIYNGIRNDEINPDPKRAATSFLILNLYPPQILYISNVLQIFITLVNTNCFNKDANILFEAFFNHTIFDNFFSSDWETFIDKYIDHAVENYRLRKSDPSNNLVHYSGGGNYYEDDINGVKKFIISNLKYALEIMQF